jgi:hypothetical protein
VSPFNENGNADRPYLKCTATRCQKFLGFIDDRGLDASNPPCTCGVPSRRQIAGRDKEVARGVHFVCMHAACGFYKGLVDEEGRRVCVEEGWIGVWVELGII